MSIEDYRSVKLQRISGQTNVELPMSLQKMYHVQRANVQFQRPPRRLRERFVGADQEAGRHPQSPHSGLSFLGSCNVTILSKLTSEAA